MYSLKSKISLAGTFVVDGAPRPPPAFLCRPNPIMIMINITVSTGASRLLPIRDDHDASSGLTFLLGDN